MRREHRRIDPMCSVQVPHRVMHPKAHSNGFQKKKGPGVVAWKSPANSSKGPVSVEASRTPLP